MDRFNLRKIPSVWTNFWKKPSNMVVRNGLLIAAALKNMSMRAKSGGRNKCLCSLSSKEMDYLLGLPSKGIFNIMEVCRGMAVRKAVQNSCARWRCIYTLVLRHRTATRGEQKNGDHFETFHRGTVL